MNSKQSEMFAKVRIKFDGEKLSHPGFADHRYSSSNR